jgi:Cupin-like domain
MSTASPPTTMQPLDEYQCVNNDNNNDDTAALVQAVQPYFDQQKPLVLRRMLTTTAKNRTALETFPRFDQYWRERLRDGTTTDCQVEVGGTYLKSENVEIPFDQFLMYLELFEQRFGKSLETNPGGPSNAPKQQDLVYLAQNDVFPRLLDDVDLPTFCLQLGQGKLYSSMIWIGPYGCISPLHQDPLDNVLMQFVGTKKVYLCSPDSPVDAGAHGNQRNTSSMNPEDHLLQLHQESANSGDDEKSPIIHFSYGTLYPGDALFIPKQWFHYIRTIETSVSLNTWFR